MMNDETHIDPEEDNWVNDYSLPRETEIRRLIGEHHFRQAQALKLLQMLESGKLQKIITSHIPLDDWAVIDCDYTKDDWEEEKERQEYESKEFHAIRAIEQIKEELLFD